MKISKNGAMTVKEFLEWSSIGRTTFYAEVNRKRIPIHKVGKRTLVKFSDAEAWLNSLDEVRNA